MTEAELEHLATAKGQAILARVAPSLDSAPPLEAGRIASMIDHTVLRAEATPGQIRTLCAEARRYGFFSVCVNGAFVPVAAAELAESGVAVCTVVGFPLGAMTATAKAFEAAEAIRAGATEIDMVLRVGSLLAGDLGAVAADIATVAGACRDGGALLKVILETALLTDPLKALAAEIAVEAGADFVKTSTGFARSGATAADVALLRAVVGPKIGVKASGGIRTLADLQTMVAAGASRVGASASVAIVEEAARA